MSDPDCGVLIAGAGLAGLSAALHLGGRPYRLVEAAESVGGLCRSVRERGFTFDYTGHLLHLRRPEIRDLVLSLVGEDRFLRIDRRSGIYSHGTYTEYPFQVNTHGLPKSVVRECVMGFAETLQRREPPPPDPTFRQWVNDTFGPGIAEHFLLPYNAKLFCTDPASMTAEWASWSVPKPNWPDVVRGALGINHRVFGYNPTFLYPAAGGIDHLPRAFLPHVRTPEVATRVVSVDAAERRARLSTGESVAYRALVSTLPLPALAEIVADAPPEVAEAAHRLRWVSVLNLNLGFDRPAPQPHHWVYFPEARFPFYRVGVYSNLCPDSVPPGHASYYVEVSHPPDEPPAVEPLAARSADLLREVGLAAADARLVCARGLSIRHAYVIHDRERREAVPALLSYLEERGIFSVGRYGAWEYSAMEDAIWHGRLAAERAAALL